MILTFEDSWGGSAKARLPGGGFYQLLPTRDGYEPRLSDGRAWVWRGSTGTAEDAEAQARRHCDDAEQEP